MAFWDSFDAETTTLLATVAGALLTYLFNERSKRRELRVTETAKLRLEAYTDLVEQARRLLQLEHARRMALDLTPGPDGTVQFPKPRFEAVAQIVGPEAQAHLDAMGFSAAKDAKTIRSGIQFVANAVTDASTKQYDRFALAALRCRMVVLDPSLREEVTALRKTALGWRAQDLTADAAAGMRAMEDRLTALEDRLARDYAVEFGGK